MSYFECVHCGSVAPIDAMPPKCPRCGHGTGVIHLKEPPAADRKPADGEKTEPGESGTAPGSA